MIRGQLLFAAGGNPIELRPLSALRQLPAGVNPLLPLQPVQRRIERSRLHTQQFPRVQPNRLHQPVSVHRPQLQRLQDQHVQSPCSLQQLDAVLVRLFLPLHKK